MGAGIARRSFLFVTICVLGLIVHGSLFPYSFHGAGGIAAAARALLDSWNTPPSGFADLVANLLLYVPLGFFGVLALPPRIALPVMTAIGFSLCTSVELAQFFDAGRVTNLSDVYLNTAGTLLGGILAIPFRLRARRDGNLLPRLEAAPVLLLLVLLAYRLYPYVPTIDMHKYWHSVKPVIANPDFAVWPVFRYFVLWLTTGYLVTAALRRPAAWLSIVLFAAFVFAAKIVIVGLWLSASELTGAALALLVWIVIPARSALKTTTVFVLLAAFVIAFRLQPFDFHPQATPFGWMPFRSLMQGSLHADLVATLEKAFLYGGLIWIGSRAGMNPWISTCLVAGLLLATSFLETHLPGRSAEITDCVMALLLGCGLAALRGFPPNADWKQRQAPQTAG